MRKLFAFLFCFLIALPVFAQAPREYHGETEPTSWLPNYTYQWLKDWATPRAVYFFNGLGDTLKVGDVVIFNQMALVDSAARASAADTLSFTDSLDNFYWSRLRFKALNAVSACSIDISGLDSTDAAQTETVILNGAANTVAYSTHFWRKINMLIWRNGLANDSLVTYGVPFQTVTTTTTANSPHVAGVVAAQSLVDTYVKVYVSGVCQASLLGATTEVLPGMYIETAGTARYGETNATEVTALRLGRALEAGNTNKLYWIWVNP